jgi:CheY-like chemotaxis protein
MPTILVVDDEPWFLKLLSVYLRRVGYHVVTAHDGAEAFQRVLEEKPDLILLDVMMPVVDGFQVLGTLKTDPELRDIPVMILTGRDQAEDILHGHRHGADFYMTKPVDRDELLLAVRRLLRQHAEPMGLRCVAGG